MLAARSVGWRSNTPSTTMLPIVSWIGPVRHDQLREHVDAAERLEVVPGAPGAGERLVAAVAEMERDRNVGLGEARPDRVVRGMAERPARGRWRWAPARAGGAPCARRVRATTRARRARRRDRRATASARAMIRSWYEKPQSSSSQRLNARSVAIVAGMSSRSACSMPHASVGNISTASRPCSSITASRASRSLVLGPQRLDLHERARVDALGHLTAEHQVHAAGDDDRIERRVRDEAEELAAHEQERVAALLHRLHPARAELLVEVAGARVDRLVVVVVGVDGAESDLHGHSLRRCARVASARKCYNISIGGHHRGRLRRGLRIPCAVGASRTRRRRGDGEETTIAREARADRRRAARPDRERRADRGRLARA